jgi:hypothetical protein
LRKLIGRAHSCAGAILRWSKQDLQKSSRQFSRLKSGSIEQIQAGVRWRVNEACLERAANK